MKKPIDADRKVPSGEADPTERDAFEKALSCEIGKAAQKGLSEVLKHEAFKDPNAIKFATKTLKFATEGLPQVIVSLLVGTLYRESDYQLPVWRGRKKLKDQIPKAELEKIVEGELSKIKEGYEWDLDPDVFGEGAKRAMDIKVIAPLIGGKLTPEEQNAVALRYAEDLLIEGVVVQKKWAESLPGIMMRAALGDKEFFQRLGKSLYEGRSPVISKPQVMLLVNWDKTRRWWSREIPGLKFWRDEAVRSLLEEWFYKDKDDGLNLMAYRSMRDRLGLEPANKKIVRTCLVHEDTKSGKTRLTLR